MAKKSKRIVQRIAELIPANGRKSFYGKARVLERGDTRYLVSYDTVVASVDGEGRVHRHSDWKSRTTCAHVRSFIGQYAAETAPGIKDYRSEAQKGFWEYLKEPREQLLLEV